MPALEFISKGKNGFGDTYYYIRDSNGVTSQVYESELDAFMKKKGAPELRERRAYLYPKKRVRHDEQMKQDERKSALQLRDTIFKARCV